MRKVITLIALVASVAIVSAAGPAKPPKAAPAPTCPVCHMALTKTKTKTNTVAVRLKKGGPVLYCCAGCKMPASVLVKPTKPTPHHTMGKTK